MNFTALAERWLDRFDVQVYSKLRTPHGRAHVAERAIATPWPVQSLHDLYICAHEIGHVALCHDTDFMHLVPRYAREFEAVRFGLALVRSFGVVPDSYSVENGKWYVGDCLRKDFLTTGLIIQVDPRVAEWCRMRTVLRHLRPELLLGPSPRFFENSGPRIRAALTEYGIVEGTQNA